MLYWGIQGVYRDRANADINGGIGLEDKYQTTV